MSGVWILAGVRDFTLLQNIQTSYGAHPASYSMGIRDLFQGYSCQGMKTTSHLQQLLSFRMSGAIPLLPLRLHGVDKENFIFFCTFSTVNKPILELKFRIPLLLDKRSFCSLTVRLAAKQILSILVVCTLFTICCIQISHYDWHLFCKFSGFHCLGCDTVILGWAVSQRFWGTYLLHLHIPKCNLELHCHGNLNFQPGQVISKPT